MNIEFKVPNLKETKEKLFEKIENSKSKLNDKDELELEELTLKWFKKIIDEYLESNDLTYSMESINVKYKKNDDQWEIEDDSELVEIFNFKI